MSRSTRFVLLIAAMAFVSIVSYFHSHAENPNFGSRVDLGLIEHPAIREASGIALSGLGYLCVYNLCGSTVADEVLPPHFLN